MECSRQVRPKYRTKVKRDFDMVGYFQISLQSLLFGICSVQFSPLTERVVWEDTRDDWAEILFQLSVREAVMSRSGMERGRPLFDVVHPTFVQYSLLHNFQAYLCWYSVCKHNTLLNVWNFVSHRSVVHSDFKCNQTNKNKQQQKQGSPLSKQQQPKTTTAAIFLTRWPYLWLADGTGWT